MNSVAGIENGPEGGTRCERCFQFNYLKSTRGAKTPDYLVNGGPEKLVVAIGDKGKGREQFKGVKIDRKLVFAHTDEPAGGRLPLFLAGFLV